MLKSSYNLGTVWGIPIKIHISLIIILPLLAIQFQSILIPVLLFASVALHELGHSYVARKKGAYVQEIMLMMLGGVAKIADMPKRPSDEVKMAIAGPLVSLAIGGIALALAFLLGGILTRTLFSVGVINLSLGLFNLIPAFPMDGGRVLRAGLAIKKGRIEATRIAAGVGKVCAVLFGIYGLTHGQPILVLIAIYIYTTGSKEYRMVLMQEGQYAGPFAQPREPRPSDNLNAEVSPPPYARHKEDPFDQYVKRAKNYFGKWFKS